MALIREKLSGAISRVALWLVQLANWITPGFYEISVEAVTDDEETEETGDADLGAGESE